MAKQIKRRRVGALELGKEGRRQDRSKLPYLYFVKYLAYESDKPGSVETFSCFVVSSEKVKTIEDFLALRSWLEDDEFSATNNKNGVVTILQFLHLQESSKVKITVIESR